MESKMRCNVSLMGQNEEIADFSGTERNIYLLLYPCGCGIVLALGWVDGILLPTRMFDGRVPYGSFELELFGRRLSLY